MTARQKWRRVMRVTVGPRGGTGRAFSSLLEDGTVGLRINAKVELDDSSKPDSATVQVWNLSPDSRGLVRQEDNVVLLEAGYEEPSLVFSGDVDEDSVRDVADGADIVTELEAGDGRRAYRNGRLTETFDGPVTSTQVLRRLADAMGLKFAEVSPDVQVVEFVQGYTVSGPIRRELTTVARTIGARWQIQHRELVVTKVGEPAGRDVVQVDEDTGLLRRPERTERGVKFVTLFDENIRPRRKVRLVSREFDGFYLVKSCSYNLDSGFGDDFYVEVDNAVEVRM